MMNKNASLKVLLEDLKVSFKFAARNIMSFVLGTIGVLIVTGLLMLFLMVVFVLALVAVMGLDGMIGLFTSFAEAFPSNPSMVTMSAILIVMLPIMAPFMVAMGALFGMAREIVESAGTTAEGVFVWYKSKFFKLAGAGLVVFSIVALPMAALALAQSPFSSTNIDPFIAGIQAALGLIWIILSVGMTSMVFPGIIDGLSVAASLRQSLRLSWRYFDRVFSTVLAFILIGLAALLPTIAYPVLLMFGVAIDPILLSVVALPTMLVLGLIVFPGSIIGMTRVYMILTADETGQASDGQPGISMVGGV